MQTVALKYNGGVFIPDRPIRLKKDWTMSVQIPDSALIKESEDELEYYDPSEPEDPPEVWQKRNKSLLALVGSIPHEDIMEMEKYVMECREIDADEW
jgi:hypothetical protein